jgi:hypothetical protein
LRCVWYRNDIDLTTNQVGGELRHLFQVAGRIAVFDCDVPAFGVSDFGQTLTKVIQIFGSVAGRPATEIPNNGHRGLLSAGSEWVGYGRAAYKRDKLAPSHMPPPAIDRGP